MYKDDFICWEATLNDGKIVNELQPNIVWNDIRLKVVEVRFITESGRISLPPGLTEYNQAKTCSATLGGKVEIESRYISAKIGNNTIKIRVNEKNRDISLEVT